MKSISQFYNLILLLITTIIYNQIKNISCFPVNGGYLFKFRKHYLTMTKTKYLCIDKKNKMNLRHNNQVFKIYTEDSEDEYKIKNERLKDDDDIEDDDDDISDNDKNNDGNYKKNKNDNSNNKNDNNKNDNSNINSNSNSNSISSNSDNSNGNSSELYTEEEEKLNKTNYLCIYNRDIGEYMLYQNIPKKYVPKNIKKNMKVLMSNCQWEIEKTKKENNYYIDYIDNIYNVRVLIKNKVNGLYLTYDPLTRQVFLSPYNEKFNSSYSLQKFTLITLYRNIPKSNSTKESTLLEKEPIDIFTKCIDLGDPELVFPGKPNIDKDRAHDELRFAFRSIFENVPWIRKVFVVMPNERLRFMKLDDPLLKDRVVFVKNKDVIPFDSSSHLTYYMNIWRMKKFGMSENVIIMDDDYLFLRPLKKSDFFYEENGKIVPAVVDTIYKNQRKKEYQYFKMVEKKMAKLGTHTSDGFFLIKERTYRFMCDLFEDHLIKAEFVHTSIPISLSTSKKLYNIVNRYYEYNTYAMKGLFRNKFQIEKEALHSNYYLNYYRRFSNPIPRRYIDIRRCLSILKYPKTSWPALIALNIGGSTVYTDLDFEIQRLCNEFMFPKPGEWEVDTKEFKIEYNIKDETLKVAKHILEKIDLLNKNITIKTKISRHYKNYEKLKKIVYKYNNNSNYKNYMNNSDYSINDTSNAFDQVQLFKLMAPLKKIIDLYLGTENNQQTIFNVQKLENNNDNSNNKSNSNNIINSINNTNCNNNVNSINNVCNYSNNISNSTSRKNITKFSIIILANKLNEYNVSLILNNLYKSNDSNSLEIIISTNNIYEYRNLTRKKPKNNILQKSNIIYIDNKGKEGTIWEIVDAVKKAKGEYIGFITYMHYFTNTIFKDTYIECKSKNIDIFEWINIFGSNLITNNYDSSYKNGALLRPPELQNWMYYDPEEINLIDGCLDHKVFSSSVLRKFIRSVSDTKIIGNEKSEYNFLFIFLVSRFSKTYYMSEMIGSITKTDPKYKIDLRKENIKKRDMIHFLSDLIEFINIDEYNQAKHIILSQIESLTLRYKSLNESNKKLLKNLIDKIKNRKEFTLKEKLGIYNNAIKYILNFEGI